MTRRWHSTVGYAVAGLVVGGLLVASGSTLAGVLVLVVFLGAAVVFSPRAFPESITDESARDAQSRDGRPIIYWRPGCPFCLRLRTSLAREARRYHWVDIWSDPDGAASVRSVADGNETVPTVVTPDRSYVNPSPRTVKSL
ncbi:glutaredoxin domain-containing protein [Actinoplanes solisilvae]|uniref:glutaredoxin domain-containing protein n=1 Tax=Actinoplanes solisilvae TaxID=2486853 RepID=UPI000FDAE4AD|nr:glutaredoxin domain-containing protein [Actinoplanes solisilvae]